VTRCAQGARVASDARGKLRGPTPPPRDPTPALGFLVRRTAPGARGARPRPPRLRNPCRQSPAPNPRRVRAEAEAWPARARGGGRQQGPVRTGASPSTRAHGPVVDPRAAQRRSHPASLPSAPKQLLQRSAWVWGFRAPEKKARKKKRLACTNWACMAPSLAPDARRRAGAARAVVAVGLAACLCGARGAAPPGKPGQLAFASLGPNFLWNCQTAGHAGHCAKINRSQATLELIDELDIGVVTDFLPDTPARAILEQIKTLPDRCAWWLAQMRAAG